MKDSECTRNQLAAQPQEREKVEDLRVLILDPVSNCCADIVNNGSCPNPDVNLHNEAQDNAALRRTLEEVREWRAEVGKGNGIVRRYPWAFGLLDRILAQHVNACLHCGRSSGKYPYTVTGDGHDNHGPFCSSECIDAYCAAPERDGEE